MTLEGEKVEGGGRQCDSREILESSENFDSRYANLSVYGTEAKTNTERNNEGVISTLDTCKL